MSHAVTHTPDLTLNRQAFTHDQAEEIVRLLNELGDWHQTLSRQLATRVSAAAVDATHRGLVIVNGSTATSEVDISAGTLWVGGKLFSSPSFTVDITASGVNGLDTGSEGSSRWYAIWAIANVSDPVSPLIRGLLSESFSAPTLPAGYTLKRLIGAVYNDSSSDFLDFDQHGPYANIELNQVLTNGSATSTSPATTLDLSAAVPPNAVRAMLDIGIEGTGDVAAFFRPSASSDVGRVWVEDPVSTGAANLYAPAIITLAVAQTIYYFVTGTSAQGQCVVSGYEIEL